MLPTPLPDLPGYGVTPDGRIWSCWSRGRAATQTDAWVVRRTWVHRDGYVLVSLKVNTKTRTYKVHRLVAGLFLGPGAPGAEVNHKDRNKQNNAVSNLEWVSRRENILHSYRDPERTRIRGERSGRTPLTETQVEDILHRCSAGVEPHHVIARNYGVSVGCVRGIHSGNRWPHVFARVRGPKMGCS